jgi:hypothetical protein
MNIDLEAACCNEEAARLLPWYVSGRLSQADSERVATHLGRCAICRADLENEIAVRTRLKSDERIEYAPQAGLAKTLLRIDELGRDTPVSASRPTEPLRRRGSQIRWLTAAVLVQAVALGWLGLSMHTRLPVNRAPPAYETLSSEPAIADGPHIRMVFAPAMRLGELQDLLVQQHLRLIGGPSEAGAYTVAATKASLAGKSLDKVISHLRASPGVLFAEPTSNEGSAIP